MASGDNFEDIKEDTCISGSEFVYDNICQPCKNDGKILEAVGLCEDCEEYLCKLCFQYHTLPTITRNHTLIDKDQVLKSKVPIQRKDQCTVRCSLHEDEIVKYFCPKHEFLGCSVCITLQHKSCDGVIYIIDVAEDVINSEEYKEYKTNLNSVESKSKDRSRKVAEKMEFFTSFQTEEIKKIRDWRKEINEALDRAENELIEKAEGIKTTGIAKLNSLSDQQVSIDAEVNAMSSSVGALERKKQYCNMYITIMNARRRLKLLDDEYREMNGDVDSIQHFFFKPNKEVLQRLGNIDEFGKLTDGIIRHVEHYTDIVVKSKTDTDTCWISGSAILPQDKLIITDISSNKKLKLVDTVQNKLTDELAMPSKPWDVTMISSIEAAVTLPFEKKIAFVKYDTALKIDRDIDVNGKCWGVAWNTDKLIVTFTEPDKVVIMDMQGTELKTIAKDENGKSVFSTPLYVTINPANQMYISNDTTKCLLCLRFDGTLIATYMDTELQRPLKAAVDNSGMVYVCERISNTVHQITKDCKKVKILGKKADGLEKPYSISYCGTQDKFYIGMRDIDKIKVFHAVYDAL